MMAISSSSTSSSILSSQFSFFVVAFSSVVACEKKRCAGGTSVYGVPGNGLRLSGCLAVRMGGGLAGRQCRLTRVVVLGEGEAASAKCEERLWSGLSVLAITTPQRWPGQSGTAHGQIACSRRHGARLHLFKPPLREVLDHWL